MRGNSLEVLDALVHFSFHSFRSLPRVNLEMQPLYLSSSMVCGNIQQYRSCCVSICQLVAWS